MYASLIALELLVKDDVLNVKLQPVTGKDLGKLQGAGYSKIPKKHTFPPTQKIGLFWFWFVAQRVQKLHLKMSASTSYSRDHGPVMISHRPHMNTVSESYLLPNCTCQLAVSKLKEVCQCLWTRGKWM